LTKRAGTPPNKSDKGHKIDVIVPGSNAFQQMLMTGGLAAFQN